MNLKIREAILLFSCSAFCLTCHADNCIRLGTNAVSAIFGDQNLQEPEQALIVEDVSRIFSVFESIDDIFPMQEGDFQSSMIKKSPEALPGKFRPSPILTRTNNVLSVFLPSALTDAYTNAMASIAPLSTVVSNAYAWIGWLKSGDVTNATYLQKCELAYSYSMPSLSTNAANNLAGSLFVTQPSLPSLLEFAMETLPSGEVAFTTWARIPYRENGESDASVFPMIYHDNKWKYYFRR